MIGPCRPRACAGYQDLFPAEPILTVRQFFFGFVAAAVAYGVLCAVFWPIGLWAFVVLGPVLMLGFYDAFQTEHTILRTFPVLGHGRYLMEMVRPEIQQYFIESSLEAYPIEREFRNVVYARSK